MGFQAEGEIGVERANGSWTVMDGLMRRGQERHDDELEGSDRKYSPGKSGSRVPYRLQLQGKRV
jgi:hypothetical protein